MRWPGSRACLVFPASVSGEAVPQQIASLSGLSVYERLLASDHPLQLHQLQNLSANGLQ